MLPRLTRQWTHLSRQAGGGGASGGIGTRGPGETQLEVDRRATRQKIGALTRALDRIRRQRETGRKRRSDCFRVALVGYTNAGKSTLLRALSGADVLVEDRLFATLDSTTRRVHLGYNRDILLTDTVGFIRKLPHHLVASFRSTLEEVLQADLLLHVVDASHPQCEDQIATVIQVLGELEVADHPLLTVFNKADCLDDALLGHLERDHAGCVFVSGLTGQGLDHLKRAVYDRLEGSRQTVELRVPQSEGRLLSDLHRVGEIVTTRYESNDVLLKLRISESNLSRLLPNGRYRRS
jgi:GTP-binding protein HflX